jgi:hypothetical protein
MPASERLTAHRGEILARWRELILGSGSRGDEGLLPRGSDPFHDPVGASLRRATEAVYDALCGIAPENLASACLDELVRIRSVQELTPSRAVGFVFLLKPAVREILGEDLEGAPAAERHDLDRRIDALGLEAFDLFMRCRQRILEIRTQETLSSWFLLLKRARLLDGQSGAGETSTFTEDASTGTT